MAVTTASVFIAATFLGTCVRENTPTNPDDCPEFVSSMYIVIPCAYKSIQRYGILANNYKNATTPLIIISCASCNTVK